MEMLIVVAIIVALAGIGVVSYFSLFADSQKDVASIKIKGLSQACEFFKVKVGSPPGSLQDLFPKYGGLTPLRSRILGAYTTNMMRVAQTAGRRPDISTVATDGTVIGNWPKTR